MLQHYATEPNHLHMSSILLFSKSK